MSHEDLSDDLSPRTPRSPRSPRIADPERQASDQERPATQAERAGLHPDMDLMMGRIIDGEDVDGEWPRFVLSADAAPAMWRALAIGQREARLLEQALAARLDACDGAGECLGRSAVASSQLAPPLPTVGIQHRIPIAARLGWATAACIAGAWIVSAGLSPQEATPQGLSGSAATIQPAAFLNPSQALDAYLSLGRESGSVVGELPGKPIIERRALADGKGYEVVFVRQIVERGRVPAMFSMEQADEFGLPVPTPMPPRAEGSGSL